MLDENQIEKIKNELAEIANPGHPGHELFYEFHFNESTDPSTILFHALGAWRITEGLHDVLWNPRFLAAASQLLGNVPVRFWHDQILLEAAKTGRRSSMAPGLFLLDKNKTRCSSYLLVRVRCFNKREWLPAIHCRKP